MGTRLYPATADIETLETLAHVPHGTARRHTELLELENQLTEIEYNRRLHSQPELLAFDDFRRYGWGKFYPQEPIGDAIGDEARPYLELFDLTPVEINLVIATGGIYWY
ncbi:MAG: hypothetical protein LLF76_02675 [Planctomycetaceae bacterium]|nr:hypothetical protein [Planctomycetaceae bacterium]